MSNHPKSIEQIKRKVKHFENANFVDIFKADGTVVLTYDDPDREIYESKSVYVMRINSLSFDQWKEEIQAFINEVNSVV
jgi:hypothetical protein